MLSGEFNFSPELRFPTLARLPQQTNIAKAMQVQFPKVMDGAKVLKNGNRRSGRGGGADGNAGQFSAAWGRGMRGGRHAWGRHAWEILGP